MEWGFYEKTRERREKMEIFVDGDVVWYELMVMIVAEFEGGNVWLAFGDDLKENMCGMKDEYDIDCECVDWFVKPGRKAREWKQKKF